MCCGSSMGDCLLLRLIGVILAFSSVVSSDMVLVVRETGDLQVTPNLKVKGSPGLNQEITSLCERIHIIGVTRFQHMNMYAHSVKLIVKASTAGADIQVCSHRNVSIPIGMCPHYQWEKVSNGSWIQKMIPLDHKILDVRIASSSKLTLQVSTVQEWFIYSIVFLIFGTVLLSSASRLSRSLAFYYTSAFSSYIFLGLLILFQIGLVGVFIPYIPAGWYLNTITALGYKKGILYHQLFNLYMVGVTTGVCSFKALVLTQDGSIDISTSHFFQGVLLILQSSVDPLLAGGALLSVFVMLSMLKKITRLIFPLDQRNRLNKILLATNERLVNAKTDMEDLIARLNQEIAVKDYLNKKMQWDMEELRQKSYEMEMKLKSREDGSSHAEPTEQSKDELDARKQQLEDLSRRYDELEAKSKADIKVFVKEVKSLRRSHVELEKKLTQSLTDKTEAEKLLQQERKLLENTVTARKKLLSDCIILHDRLKEYNLNLDSEVSDNL